VPDSGIRVVCCGQTDTIHVRRESRISAGRRSRSVGSSICSAYVSYNCTRPENYVTGLEKRTAYRNAYVFHMPSLYLGILDWPSNVSCIHSYVC
jgi:hypothetical protein